MGGREGGLDLLHFFLSQAVLLEIFIVPFLGANYPRILLKELFQRPSLAPPLRNRHIPINALLIAGVNSQLQLSYPMEKPPHVRLRGVGSRKGGGQHGTVPVKGGRRGIPSNVVAKRWGPQTSGTMINPLERLWSMERLDQLTVPMVLGSNPGFAGSP